MIEKSALQQYATKQQTKLSNVLREYYQHMYLSAFYQQKGSDHFFFKGGTALKIVFRSPRYSENLDFTAIKNSHQYENLLQDVLLEMEKEGITNELVESKRTSGGHLAIIQATIYDETFSLKIEISFQKNSAVIGERVAVAPDYFPGYIIQILAAAQLMSEKLAAAETRHKPRDFFDLYYILRADLLSVSEREKLRRIIPIIPKDSRFFTKELIEFLPTSFQRLLPNFPQLLAQEIEKFL